MRILSEIEQQPKPTNRLRQRLVGGLVVAALAVLLLPLWLDNGGLKTPSVQPVPKSPTIAQPAQITIPKPPPAQQHMLQSPPASPAPATEPMPTPAQESPAPTPSNVPAPTSSKQPPTAQTAAKQTQDTSTQPEALKKPTTVDDSAPTQSTNTKKPAVTQPAAPSGGRLWVVQLGSFSDELNAKGLARSVSQAGFKVEITPLFAKKGTVWRVRVGPYANRDLAVKATAQLREKLGRDGLAMPQ